MNIAYRSENKKRNQYFLMLIFLILITDAGFLTYYSSQIVLVVKLAIETAFTISALLRIFFNQEILQNRSIVGFFILLVLSVASSLVYTLTRSTVLSFILLTVFAWAATQRLDYNLFKKTYINIITFISIGTIILFLILTIMPEAKDILPKLLFRGVSNTGKEYFKENVTIGIANIDYISVGGMMRSKGPFWEPGVLPAYICMAIYFSLSSENFKLWKVILMIVACATSLSTAAFAALILVLFALLNVSGIPRKTKRKIISCIIVGVTAITIYLVFIDPSKFDYVWGKISFLFTEDSFNVKDVALSGGTSFLNRFSSFITNIFVFFDHPLLGVGIGNSATFAQDYAQQFNAGRYIHQTATFTNYFATFGLLGGAVCVFGWIRFFMIDKMSALTKVLLIGAIFITLTNENLTFSAFFVFVIFLGLNSRSLVKSASVMGRTELKKSK